MFQSIELKAQNEQLLTVNTSLGSEVTKLQKELDLIRGQQVDGDRVLSLQEQVERLQEELQEAQAERKRLLEEHSNEKMNLTQVWSRGRGLIYSLITNQRTDYKTIIGESMITQSLTQVRRREWSFRILTISQPIRILQF